MSRRAANPETPPIGDTLVPAALLVTTPVGAFGIALYASLACKSETVIDLDGDGGEEVSRETLMATHQILEGAGALFRAGYAKPVNLPNGHRGISLAGRYVGVTESEGGE